ncbi:MAG: UvrD-helicase domain-containing protein [Gemmatimonadetes bacterium]|nr:UvrD-helicase domain-containing protein [Gemmatimonadota bacterium]MCB9504931.1 UvrD-helicase domain-containing protein [Gemmatimonadales bacterium]MCB9518250.1 UvrD-helicase domain-containing protein [Gemmatimonadales bacterium]HRX19101.1 UvrD-helicase domain-containing protein [Gemmatimonadales bacterium]
MTDDLLRVLNPAQREAAAHVAGPILVLAGAGSGKTRVLTTRIAQLIAVEGVRPERIFAVTFTNKAAGEMKARVGELLSRDPTGLWIGTFHSLSGRLLRREAERIGFTRGYTIYDQDDTTSLVKRLLDERNHPAKVYPPRVIQGIISGAKNRMQTAQDLERSAPGDPTIRVAADVYVALQQALRLANAMDFDDLLLHPLALFRDHPDVRERWRARFDYLLVDEFQDTNTAQYRLIHELGSGHRNIFAVGDDDQSIYGWRGADVGNMQLLRRDFPEAALVRLEENYRSTRPILDAANAVIARNTGRLGKTLRAVRPGGDSLVVLGAADERDEAEWVAAELARRERAGVPWHGMAVLYRTNAQSRALEEALRRAGTPYRIVGAISFFDRREVKDLLAYVRLVANPSDDQAFLRAITVPKRGIGPAALAELQAAARQWNVPLLVAAGRAETIHGLRPGVRTALLEFAALVERSAARAGNAAPAVVMEELLTALDYETLLLAEGLEGAERWENVRELVASAADWSEVVVAAEDQEPGTPLQRWLAESALLSAVDTTAGSDDGVTLMTLHTAKGLEWPVVVLAGMEDGLFPLARAMESTEGLEEERRLCYVGITRARDALLMTWARSRRRGGDLRPGAPSRFLRELPAELVDERRTSFGGSTLSAGWSGSGTWGGAGGLGGSRTGGTSSGRRGGTSMPRPRPAQPTGPLSGIVGVGEENQDAPRYIKGERVRHRRFGSGAILGLAGAGKDTKVSVAFDDPEVGTKQLLVAFAGLERDWEGA